MKRGKTAIDSSGPAPRSVVSGWSVMSALPSPLLVRRFVTPQGKSNVIVAPLEATLVHDKREA